ncbi:hypothetical protein A1OE_740 [Candidatus Endolissoclinum faulkneri L2]|uniref:Uncharacterized protein n=1 Tax=Candidatus Endolissoclinum faulkneri L2 TaxID=1193729 RepID=K7ZCV3_9PROT|nr:hypothetical protein A1OE_740 [Candidatus Endolissoclinum faulkneri L2]
MFKFFTTIANLRCYFSEKKCLEQDEKTTILNGCLAHQG